MIEFFVATCSGRSILGVLMQVIIFSCDNTEVSSNFKRNFDNIEDYIMEL